MTLIGKNWKTGLSGWLALIATGVSIVQDLLAGKPIDTPTVIGVGSAAIGLIKAKDFDVTGGSRANDHPTEKPLGKL